MSTVVGRQKIPRMDRRVGLYLQVGIVCHAGYFFGFLYEAIVDVPNMLGARAVQAQALWDPYHWLTNPGFYYTIVGMPALVSLVLLLRRRTRLSLAGRVRLRASTGCHLVMMALTTIAVTQINDTLYFGAPIGDLGRVHFLAGAWFLVNAARISVTAVVIANLMKIYTEALAIPVSSAKVPGSPEVSP
ncbi:hypothetical protein ACFV30_37650 [Streptomyces sp. NPDC059752]|uniref:hypothetical protein n=1 Tax=unclassified Streptomyces TaxID=2593676 RepID=UPI00364E15C5